MSSVLIQLPITMETLHIVLIFAVLCMSIFLVMASIRIFNTVRSEVVFGRNLILYGISIYVLFSIIIPLIINNLLFRYFSKSILETLFLVVIIAEGLGIIMMLVGFRRNILSEGKRG
jgi:hypothetical protein